MLSKGDRVEILGGQYKGKRGVVTRPDKGLALVEIGAGIGEVLVDTNLLRRPVGSGLEIPVDARTFVDLEQRSDVWHLVHKSGTGSLKHVSQPYATLDDPDLKLTVKLMLDRPRDYVLSQRCKQV
jgi:hypothetical protein